MIGRRKLTEFEVRLARLEAQQSRTRWWNIASGVAATIAAALGLITLLTILVQRTP